MTTPSIALGLVAAVYVRKSTEQNGLADEAKSVTRQIEHAKMWATRHGHTVLDGYIFVDDGISGAEFVKRAGYTRLMASLEPRPPFQALILMEESRLGRDQIATMSALQAIIDAGVRVFCYLDDREVTLDDATQIAMAQLRGFGGAVEREHASKRTYKVMLEKFLAGHVTGGRVYGYRNVDVFGTPDQDGRPRRSHVVQEIHPEQADVLRRMATLYADGLGYTRIAKALNADGIPSPRGGTGSWAGTAIRAMLCNPLYRGIVVWNRSQKIMRRRTKAQRKRPPIEVKRIEAPHLKIFSDDLCARIEARMVQARAVAARRPDGTLLSRPARLDGVSPYLLTGRLICKGCRGALGGSTQLHGTGPKERRTRVTSYHCVYHAKRGATVCDNDVVLRTEIADQAVLDALCRVVTPDMVAEAVERALADVMASEQQRVAERVTIEQALAASETQISGIVKALIAAPTSTSLAAVLTSEEQRRAALRKQLHALDAASRVTSIDTARVKREIRDLVGDVAALLQSQQTVQVKQMLRKVLPTAITGEPITVDGRRGYRFSGTVSFEGLLRGDVLEAVQRKQPDGGGPNGRG